MVDVSLYTRLVEATSVGKRLPQAVYLHADAVTTLAAELRSIIEAASALLEGVSWNVVKLATEGARISFLWYPRFFEDGFPALASSAIVDLLTEKVTRREYGDVNPPILHRKESMLPQGHAAIPQSLSLTRAAEQYGLFEASREIGLRREWEARICRLRLRVDGHRFVAVEDSESSLVVHRHRTALSRSSLSAPVQALWRHGLIHPGRSIFDYGCGRGDDVRTLQASGIAASGWDPHFASDAARIDADVVNLGFVLNVIEDPQERTDALRGAWNLTRSVLAVGVLIGGRQAFERHRLFRDGVLTGRGTFQKYFASSEFRDYLESVLGREPVVVAPGIAFVFRDDADEQAFLAKRSRRDSVRVTDLSPLASPASRQRVTPRAAKWQQHAGLANAFFATCVSLGRLPELDEFSSLTEVHEHLGRPASVLRRMSADDGSGSFEQARAQRRNDVLVFLALRQFERRRSVHSLPELVRRDLRAHWRSANAAQTEASALLFAIADPRRVLREAQAAAIAGIGWLDREHSLQLHSSRAPELPPLLRVYLGCASRLYGDVDSADLVKIHIWSGKVSLMTFDAFDERSMPDLIERVKINLRTQTIDFFAYGTATTASQPLYMKSRFMRLDDERYPLQVALEQRLRAVPDLSFADHGPSRADCAKTLERHGMALGEFDVRFAPRDCSAN